MHGGTHHDWDDVLDERTPVRRRICIDLGSSSAADSPWAAAGGHVYSDAPGAEDNAHRLPSPTGGSGPEQGPAASSVASCGSQRSRERLEGSRIIQLAAWGGCDRPWTVYLRIGLAACVVCWSAASLVAVLLSTGRADEADPQSRVTRGMFIAHITVGLIAATAFIVTLGIATTFHFRLVAAYMFFTWLQVWSRGLLLGFVWRKLYVVPLVYALAATFAVSSVCLVILTVALVYFWIQTMQVTSQGAIRKRTRLTFCLGWLLTSLLAYVGLVAGRVHFGGNFYLPIFLSFCSVLLAALSFAGISLAYLHRVWRISAAVFQAAEGRLKDAAWDAKTTALLQFIGVAWCYTTMAVHLPLYVVMGMFGWSSLAGPAILIGLFDALSNVVTAFALSGVFTGSFVGEVTRIRMEYQRIRLRAVKRKAWRRSSSTEWHGMLETLADRGFTLDALLRFYKGLGREYMSHFDSSRHTTADVVFGAIVPLSRERATAYATIMMDGKPTRPEKMVTHWWGNLFKSLVGAILADALAEPEYALITYLMDNDMERLEAWVAGLGKGSATYWICCFSVNQHLGICGSPSQHQKDPVTGLAYQACSCSTAKVLNETHPCHQGKSIRCEMNKFDEMLAFIGATSNLEQVVAVDEGFQLFTRAWCVAELAVCAEMGITQHLKVHSRAMLNRHLHWLSDLRIEDMDASRPEDKKEILSKIQDIKEFDSKLRALLTERLFPDWRSLNRVDQMCRVGSLARWHSVSQLPHLDDIWQRLAVGE